MTPTLQQWLNTATQDIGLLGKQRIESEITAHWERALQVAIENGHSEEEARAIALEFLGDANEAQKRFSKTHLTRFEEHTLNGYMSVRKRPLFYLFMTAVEVATFGAIIYFLAPDLFFVLNNPYFMFSLVVYGALVCWSQRRISQGHTRYLLEGELKNLSVMIIFIPHVFTGLAQVLYALLMGFIFISIMYFRYWKRFTLPLLRKAPKQLSEEEMNLLHEVYNKGFSKS
jgi:hypothetical protein